MDADCFFYEQTRFHTFPKRLKKMVEDLPDSLKFAHLNPKVAAFLANKDKQKQNDNGSGSKNVRSEVSQTFSAVKNHLDSYITNDEDYQRYLFEEATISADNILFQLSHIIYYYENIASHIPRSLEYQMMSNYSELTSDVKVVFREWQSQTNREEHQRKINEAHDADAQEKVTNVSDDSPRIQTQSLESGHASKKRFQAKTGLSLPEIIEDGEKSAESGHQTVKSVDGRMSQTSKSSKQSKHKLSDMKGGSSNIGKLPGMKRGPRDFDRMSSVTETASDMRSTMTNALFQTSVIQFQLSSKACEEKGWIFQKGKEEELDQNAILEYCVHKLQQELKNIKEQRSHETQMGLISPLVVRYYGDAHRETLLKYRKSPLKTSSHTSMRDGKPCVPKMVDDSNEGRQLMLTTHIDGTTVAYYPSGQPAVVASAAGFGRPGFYTIIYEDDSSLKMLGIFTPSGRGVCYHTNGTVRFLATARGGHMANREGKVIQHWKWPQTQVKLTTPVQFQLNQHLSFRCVAENYMVIVFTCMKESARFFVNASPGAGDYKKDENEQLLTSYKFSSKTAKNLQKQSAPKSKFKSKKKKDKLTKELAELVKSVDIEDKVMYELESDKEHARLQRKARNLVDDWLEHYRVTIGLKSPTLTQITDTPYRKRSGAFSAKDAERKENVKESLDQNNQNSRADKGRSPSAPSKASAMNQRDINDGFSSAHTVKFEGKMDIENNDIDGKGVGSFVLSSVLGEKLSQLSQSSIKIKSASNHTKSSTSLHLAASPQQEKDISILNLSMCTFALRKSLLLEPMPQCRCSRHVIPYIMDLEFETYITEVAPENQLQVIAVVSSLYPKSNPAEMMLNQIYEEQNRNRTRPCVQCRLDTFRLLRYDINTAAEGSDHNQPFLLQVHNVVPGMFLIYGCGRLLFCDHIFNGYGNARKDFKKQVKRSELDFIHGLSLPKDFRFSPSCGEHGLRSPWGGEIGGAGVDHFGNPGIEPAQVPADKDVLEENSKTNIRNLNMANFLSTSLSTTMAVPPAERSNSSRNPFHSLEEWGIQKMKSLIPEKIS